LQGTKVAFNREREVDDVDGRKRRKERDARRSGKSHHLMDLA
jgi:hypothetical protein